MAYQPDVKYWQARGISNNGPMFSCIVCQDGLDRKVADCKAHERTQGHIQRLRRFKSPSPEVDSNNHPTPSTSTSQRTNRAFTDDTLRALLVSATFQPDQPRYPPGHPNLNVYSEPNFLAPHSRSGSPGATLDWGLYESENTIADPTPQEQLINDISQATLEFLNENISDFEDDDPSDSDIDVEQISDHGPRKRARTNLSNTGQSEEWFPWEDKITCSLDILMHLPRSVFSRKQLDLFLWLLRINNVDDVPSTKSLNLINKFLQNSCGIDTLAYEGKLGHRYHVNNMAQILAQEVCNPKVRPHLHFYPEDTGKKIGEGRQAERWLKLPPEEATPMVRIRGDDYYIYEPALIKDLSVCIPERWFTRDGTFFARAWKMEIQEIEGQLGWVVHKEIELEVSEHQFAKGFATLEKEFGRYWLPHPSLIHGFFPKEDAFQEQDTHSSASMFTFTGVGPTTPQMLPSTGTLASWPQHAPSPMPGPSQPSRSSFASSEPGIQTSNRFSGATSMQSLLHGFIASQKAPSS